MDEPGLLAANEAFYAAFRARDLQAMESLWARHCPCVCIHPGWSPILGRGPILRAWAAILANESSPTVEGLDPQVVQLGDDVALVLCIERVESLADSGIFAATNTFVREDDRWYLAHHQASPIAVDDSPDEPVAPADLPN